MTSREQFLKTIADEIAIFARVFAAMPKKNLSYRPHKQSKSAKQMAALFASEPSVFKAFLKTGIMDWAKYKEVPVKHFGEASTRFVRMMKEAQKMVERMSEKDWNSYGAMTMGKEVVLKATRGEIMWSMLFDLIHHRGQISTYIRPMGGKVPSIYGPSGDSGK